MSDPVPEPSSGLVTLHELRLGIQRIEKRLVLLTEAIKASLAAGLQLRRVPAPKPTPPDVTIPARYGMFVEGGQVARRKGIPREANPLHGDRGIAGARRKWWFHGWDHP